MSQVHPEFQQALKKAIAAFVEAKKPLWSHHIENVAAMERVVNNSMQTNRECRDNTRQVCNDINKNWRNWLSSSLLADKILEVLNDPKFNVEKMYETVIDQQTGVIELQESKITQLEKKNKMLTNRLPEYYTALQQELKEKENQVVRLEQLQQESNEQLKQNQQLILTLNSRLEAREQNYQSLHTQYLQTLKQQGQQQTAPAKKNFSLTTQMEATKKTCKSDTVILLNNLSEETANTKTVTLRV